MNIPTERKCPKCGQRLRFPENIGGMLMACPSCGQKFRSDFKVGGTGCGRQQNVFTAIFEMPAKMIERLLRFLSGKS